MNKSIDTDYEVVVDGMNKTDWTDVISLFDDAFLYNTWSYGAVRWGAENLSHLVLKKGPDIVAAAQLRIVKVPIFMAGIAYITWGPLWRRRDRQPDPETYRMVLRALTKEYCVKRRFLLRINSAESFEDKGLLEILKEEGFLRQESPPARRTIFLNLGQSPEDLRAGFVRGWKKNLRLAENSELEIEHGKGLGLFDAYFEIHKELVELKPHADIMDPQEFRAIQADLPEEHKMDVMICRLKGRPVAGVVWSSIGSTVLDTLAAANEAGRDHCAAYLLRWKEWVWMHENGYARFDFGGIDPERNPGVYRFKAGALGKNEENGEDLLQLGHYVACEAILSAWLVGFVDCWYRLKKALEQRFRSALASRWNLRGQLQPEKKQV